MPTPSSVFCWKCQRPFRKGMAGAKFPVVCRTCVQSDGDALKAEAKTVGGLIFSHTDSRPFTKNEKQKTMRQASIGELHKYLKPGDTVYTVLRHVSSSKMTRTISLLVPRLIHSQPALLKIDRLVADLGIGRWNPRHDGIVIQGIGMDMGFELVYQLGRILFPGGGNLSKTHPLRRRQIEAGEYTQETDGGYLLRQEWI